MELTLDTIKDLISDSKTYSEGEQLFNTNSIVSFDIDKTFKPHMYLVNATIKQANTYNHVDISMNKSDNSMKGYLCTCSKFENNGIVCEHIIATLIKINEYLNNTIRKEEIITLDKNIENLITNYENKIIYNTLSETYNDGVNVVPYISIINNKYLSFSIKVGKTKYYKVKDLKSFVNDINNHYTTTYGNELSFIHDLNNFNIKSRNIISFILQHINDIILFKDYKVSNDTLILTNESSNIFIKLLLELNEKYIIIDNIDHKLNVIENNPELILDIIQEDEDNYNISLDTNYSLITSNSNIYYIKNNNLYMCDNGFSTNLDTLLNYFLDHKYMIINKLFMNQFYSSILISVEPFITIRGDLSDFVPVEMTPKIYIDLQDKNTISVKLYYGYEVEDINAFLATNSKTTRNLSSEILVKLLLKKYLTRIDERAGIGYIENSLESMFNFITKGIEELDKSCNIYTTKAINDLHIKESKNLSVGVRIENDLLHVNIDTSIYSINDIKEILNAYQSKRKYYRLKNGCFVDLKDGSLSELSNVLNSLHIKTTDLKEELVLNKYHALSFEQALSNTTLLNTNRSNEFKAIIKDIHNINDSTFEVIEHLKPILRNYQKKGYRWLKTMSSYGFSGILADDMGIGKTLQVIALLEDEVYYNKDSINLVVCPTSLILNWKDEINKFAKYLKPLVITGNQQTRSNLLNNIDGYNVIITSYDYLKKDVELYEDYNFNYFIVDEAQYIKNHMTKNAISVKSIKSKYKFALTGTPIENSLAELWSIFDFLMPNYLYSYNDFKIDYEVPIIKMNDERANEELIRLVEPFILRRLKKDVLKELPDKIEQTILLEMNEESRKLYDANLLSVRNDIIKNDNENKILVLTLLTRLRQICCDPTLVYEDYNSISVKVEATLDIIRQAKESNKKVLLFSQFTSILSIVEKRLHQEDISYFVLKGDTPKQVRSRLVSSYQNDNTDVFLISLKAGGTGINLTSAEIVIHFDPWWNLSAQNQATDRAYRLGQKNRVQVYKLICKDTIEEKILKLQDVKKDLSDNIIKSNQGVISNMTTDEILDLLE